MPSISTRYERTNVAVSGRTTVPIAESKVISISILRSQRDVYDFAAQPASFALWASSLGKPHGNEGPLWRFEGENGPVNVRFTERNAYGVLDHYVALPDGTEIYVPMRVISERLWRRSATHVAPRAGHD